MKAVKCGKKIRPPVPPCESFQISNLELEHASHLNRFELFEASYSRRNIFSRLNKPRPLNGPRPVNGSALENEVRPQKPLRHWRTK